MGAVRAIDPEATYMWEYEGVIYTYRQPAGTYMGATQKEHGDALIDSCLVSVKGLEGADALREKGYAWAALLPQAHANRLYLEILTAGRLTEVEAEG
jgi:hypothetical protein